MALSSHTTQDYSRRLLRSRMRILHHYGFYGLLLMHVSFSLDEKVRTAATDGRFIVFNPSFLDDLSNEELDFVLMHEVLHIVLRHCSRTGNRDNKRFNEACDIVVNSNILKSTGGDLAAITLDKYGESMHLTPDGDEGAEYTAEEVYEMLESISQEGSQSKEQGIIWDDHSEWGETFDPAEETLWNQRVISAVRAYEERQANEKGQKESGRGTDGSIPPAIRSLVNQLINPKIDWKVALNDFVQQEVVDYSLLPPDKRFADSPFFLPDFNDKEDYARDILFMIDTSGSMSDNEITEVYEEVMSAVEQFGGKLTGWLGFFDDRIVPPVPFQEVDDIESIIPRGGCGTDFHIIFSYISETMQSSHPAALIIMTDGYAPFPDESMAEEIPVLWVINNENVDPPWGKTIRITQ